MPESVPASYFIDLYKRESDPWRFATSEYERQKYETTLQALPSARYGSAFEAGCSIGVFTRMLARRCDRLLAVDVSEDALFHAQRRCQDMPHVRFEQMNLLQRYPDDSFDLTTICEIGFYFDANHLYRLRDLAVAHSAPNATIVLVHWTPRVDGHATTTQEVHAAFAEAPGLRHLQGFSAKTYRLDVFEKR